MTLQSPSLYSIPFAELFFTETAPRHYLNYFINNALNIKHFFNDTAPSPLYLNYFINNPLNTKHFLMTLHTLITVFKLFYNNPLNIKHFLMILHPPAPHHCI